jgi:hypothetical protein
MSVEIANNPRWKQSTSLKGINESPISTGTKVLMQDGAYFHNTDRITYPGSWIRSNLRDDWYITQRIASGYIAMGQLTKLFTSHDTPLDIKLHMYHTIPVNTALWGCGTWALCDSNDANRLNIFHHCSILMILGISMRKVREERIRNEEIRKRFFDIPLLTDYAKRRTRTFTYSEVHQQNYGRGKDEAAPYKNNSSLRHTVTPQIKRGEDSKPHTRQISFCVVHSINQHTYNPEGCAHQILGKARRQDKGRNGSCCRKRTPTNKSEAAGDKPEA